MKKFKINVLSILSISEFAFVLTYNLHFDDNPVGYVCILLLYGFESIRAYIEGLKRGFEIIKESLK